MGNNKKTVRCSFCNKLGHNRVSCERLKEGIDLNRENYGSNHPDVKKYDNYMTKVFFILSHNCHKHFIKWLQC